MHKPITIYEHFCDRCGKDLNSRNGFPHFTDTDGDDFCPDCALKNGVIDAMTWIRCHGGSPYHHAVYEGGKVIAYIKCGRGFSKDVIEIE